MLNKIKNWIWPPNTEFEEVSPSVSIIIKLENNGEFSVITDITDQSEACVISLGTFMYHLATGGVAKHIAASIEELAEGDEERLAFNDRINEYLGLLSVYAKEINDEVAVPASSVFNIRNAQREE